MILDDRQEIINIIDPDMVQCKLCEKWITADSSYQPYCKECHSKVFQDCDGRQLFKNEYPVLFEALSGQYGSNNETFNLPDMRGNGDSYIIPEESALKYKIKCLPGNDEHVPVGTMVMLK